MSTLPQISKIHPNLPLGDIIHIEQFKTKANIGIEAWEQQSSQNVAIDIDYPVDCETSANSDNIETTCNYAALTEMVSQFCEANRFNLLETLAEKLASEILKRFTLDWVTLRIRKIGVIAKAQHVSICIHRSKK